MEPLFLVNEPVDDVFLPEPAVARLQSGNNIFFVKKKILILEHNGAVCSNVVNV